MGNLLKAIKNIAEYPVLSIKSKYEGSNRVNNEGEALEEYIKDIFSGTLNEPNELLRNERHSEVFSYFGNKINPPDCILIDSDAIEVKKIEKKNSTLALNSSYPKKKLYCDDSRITDTCKFCEKWTEKDIIYAIGCVKHEKLSCLWLVYGDCYAANRDTYQRIANIISEGLENISDIELAETKELGAIKKVDPLGITNLRIRGMWHIENPNRVFDYIPKENVISDFAMYCLMRTDKYNSFNLEDRTTIEALENLKISNVQVKNPDNPARLLDCKFMEYYYNE